MTRVLIVDDHEGNRYLLRVLLEGHGLIVDEARHGAEALTAARANPPDLVISDLLMPVMDGYALLSQWRSDERLKEDICERMYTSTECDTSDVTVEVKSGVVTLEGTVSDRRSKYMLEEMLDNVPGVKDVENRVRIQRGDESWAQGGSSQSSSGASTQGRGASGMSSSSAESFCGAPSKRRRPRTTPSDCVTSAVYSRHSCATPSWASTMFTMPRPERRSCLQTRCSSELTISSACRVHSRPGVLRKSSAPGGRRAQAGGSSDPCPGCPTRSPKPNRIS